MPSATRRMNAVSLFSGVGGLDLALHGLAVTRLYCEIDPRCAAVLRARMAAGDLPEGPVHRDVRTLDRAALRGYLGDAPVDIVFGGFPCQDLSTAGARRGLDGERSGLFWEIMRVLAALPAPPPFVLLENVAGIRSLALRQVGTALAAAGYDCRWTTLRVSALGGHHRRERWFCLARRRPPLVVAHAEGERGEHGRVPELPEPVGGGLLALVRGLVRPTAEDTGLWLREPDVARVVDGVPERLDVDELRRNHMLGNAVCPQQARFAFEVLAGMRPHPSKPGVRANGPHPLAETYPDITRLLRRFRAVPPAETYPDLTRLLLSFSVGRPAPRDDGPPAGGEAARVGFYLACAE